MRAQVVRNLPICDGSPLATSGSTLIWKYGFAFSGKAVHIGEAMGQAGMLRPIP